MRVVPVGSRMLKDTIENIRNAYRSIIFGNFNEALWYIDHAANTFNMFIKNLRALVYLKRLGRDLEMIQCQLERGNREIEQQILERDINGLSRYWDETEVYELRSMYRAFIDALSQSDYETSFKILKDMKYYAYELLRKIRM